MIERGFEGIHTALLTPFDSEERIDDGAIGRLVDDQVDHGVHGIVVNGSTGEFAALSERERRHAVEVAAGVLDARVALTVHVGAMTTGEAVRHCEHALRHGAGCAMLVTPYYGRPSDSELVGYVREVARVGLPIMLYNIPDTTGYSLSPELLARMAEIESVGFVKDTTGALDRIFRLRELCGSQITVVNGEDTIALPGFLSGCRGMVWGACNAIPDACLELWRAAVHEQDLETAAALWSNLYPLVRFIEAAGYVAAVKAATELRGLSVGAPRRPALPLASDSRDELQRLVGRLVQVTEGAR